MTLSLLSEDCFSRPPSEKVWVMLCGESERTWRILGPYWTLDQLEAQMDRSRTGCTHGHHYRKASLDELDDVDVKPSWILSPVGTTQDREQELKFYLNFCYQYFPERLPYHDPF